MAEKWHVRPARPPLNVAHPVDGPLANEPDAQGNWSFWTQDQFTFQLLRDGDIERVPEPEKQAPAPAPVRAQSAPIPAPEPLNSLAMPARKKEPR
jgi:hypothetical protein